MEMTKNKRVPTRSINQYCGRSHDRGTKSLFNSIVFAKEIIMKKIKMNKRFGLNRQKSRAIVENVPSGMKAGFKSILNLVFNQKAERKKMENQKSKSTFSATLLTLTLMVAALGVSSAAVAAEKKMVKDPTTGKMVSAPEWGGTLTLVTKHDWDVYDAYHSPAALSVGSVVIEKLAIIDWAIDRNKYPFVGGYQAPVYALRGALAESWEQPDDTTYIFHIRQGVHWHDKPPVSGRELTAMDVEHSYHRHLGLGSGFTKPSAYAGLLGALPWESIEATDKWTVVMKLKEPTFAALGAILDGYIAIQPPEVIEQSRTAEVPEGKISDWRDMVGTGPYMITDWVRRSSYTYTKNPDYWSYDEKYPENRLPYIDEVRGLVMPEVATFLAALRSAKVDYIGWHGAAQLNAVDQAESLRRTNPELVIHTWSERSNNVAWLNVSKSPYDDIRVRHAMQMALDLETMNDTYYKGYADTIPRGRVGREFKEYTVLFEEWPDELKGYYTYDVAGAEKLLDEAGYPRGADGIRFKTRYMHPEGKDLSWAELVASYWREIGVDVDIEVVTGPEQVARQKTGDFAMTQWLGGVKAFPPRQMEHFWSGYARNAVVRDAQYDAWYEAMLAATTVEEQMSAIKDMDMRSIEQHWMIWGPLAPAFNVHWPWVIGYNGEGGFGRSRGNEVFARLWIDSELKKEMGH